jgi:hypothetical protein
VGSSKIPGGGGEVKLNFKGIGELLRSPAVASELRQRMLRVQSALPGSELEVTTKGRRARAKVTRGSDYDEANTGDMARALSLSGGQRGYKVKTNKPKPRRSG